MIDQDTITEEEIRKEQERLAARAGVSVAEAYLLLEAGAYHGTILESKLRSCRFLLGGEP